MNQTPHESASTDTASSARTPDNVPALLGGLRHLIEEARAAVSPGAADDQRQLASARLAAAAPLLDALCAAWSAPVQTSEPSALDAAKKLEAAAEIFGVIAGKSRQLENLLGHMVSSGDFGLADSAEAVAQVIGATADSACASCGGLPVVSQDAGAWIMSRPTRLHLAALGARRAALPV